MKNRTASELQDEVNKFPFWYHKIDLGQGVITPGLNFDPLWNMIRETRKSIDYHDKKVLDIASFDGMWAFEAEKLGAELVVATDCYYETYKNFLFCKDILDSNVIPYYNISPYDLWNRMDVFLQENWREQKPYDRLFDVVQHLGLLYHLRDPMLSLSQARSVMRIGGYLLMETAVVINEEDSFMLYNGVPPDKQRIYEDITTWWAPTLPCLKEMLRASLFEPIGETIHVLGQDSMTDILKQILKRFLQNKKYTISRVSLVAKPVSSNAVDNEFFREMIRTYRNPGLAGRFLSDKAD
jgi:SAM-dependent methyltransferase